MTTKHCSILTNRGKALEAASASGGVPVVLDGFVVGDGNGHAVTPEAGQTALVREVYRGTISRLAVSPDQENQFIAYLALPEGVGGFTVREAGLLTSDGELYAVGSCAAIEKPENGVTATLQFRLAVAESAQVTLKVATGDGLFLRQDRNLSDVEDRDESVENLGLKPTVDKAKNSVQRDGDNMTGELKIRGVNALRIFNDAFGLIFRRSEESLHLIPTQENQGENGDIGPLRPFSINLRTGEISMSHKVSVGGGSQVNGALGIGVQNALGGNSIAFGDNDTGLKQNGDGLLDVYANGQHVFRFQNGALQSNRAVNVSGRVTPTDYGNFDERYQTKTGGVQNFQYTSEVFYNPGGNELSWTFRAPPGCTLSGIVVQETGSSSADNIGGVYYKQAQIYINGAWRSVSG
ncbi:phage tail protein [Escherichia coli]|uniref:phage tail protein n=1 Tax=Escherichia TaxID=561 RepID=UPI00028C641C|nr:MULTISPECIES: phage tail protein [Escherichia]DAL27880.1 MAG TPA_asm: tail collar fiber protein [Caudoviricetes sp.]EFB2552505.1 phage tail protein [Escherichia coli]EFC1703643.1 phage tail protein [Escherichia coli]EGD0622240.1 phage tail protein [Escherichia coli]EHL1441625.1 phage tail protein [Escherichia coli]